MCQRIVWCNGGHGNVEAFAGMQRLPITYILFLLHLIAEAKISTNMFYVAEKWSLIFLLPLAGFSSVLCGAGMLWVAALGHFSLDLLAGHCLCFSGPDLCLAAPGLVFHTAVDTERSRDCLLHQPETLTYAVIFHSTCY